MPSHRAGRPLAELRRDGAPAGQQLGPDPVLLARRAQEAAELASAVAVSRSSTSASIRAPRPSIAPPPPPARSARAFARFRAANTATSTLSAVPLRARTFVIVSSRSAA